MPVPLQVQKTEIKPMIIPRRDDKAIYKKTSPNPNTKTKKLDWKTCDKNYKAQKESIIACYTVKAFSRKEFQA